METSSQFEDSYRRLQDAFTWAQIKHNARHGPGTSLLLLWAFGLLPLLVVWYQPLLAIVWTGFIATAVLMAERMASRSPATAAFVLRLLISRQLRLAEFASQRARNQVALATEAMVEVLLSTGFSRPHRKVDPIVRRILVNLYDILELYAEAEFTAFLPRDQRRTIASEASRLLASAKNIFAGGSQNEVFAWPRRLHEFLIETQDGLSKAFSAWSVTDSGHNANPVLDLDDEAAPSLASEQLPLQLWQRRTSLQVGFEQIQFQPGQNALEHLNDRYERLLFVLKRKRDGDPIVAAEIPPLAEEAYRQAISALEDALDLAHGVHPPDRERLEREVAELEAETATLSAQPDAGERLLIRQDRLRSHRERLQAIESQELSIEVLLHECERCEACLDSTRMELASLKGESAALAISAVTATLRGTVDRARSVQDELKHLTR